MVSVRSFLFAAALTISVAGMVSAVGTYLGSPAGQNCALHAVQHGVEATDARRRCADLLGAR